MGTIARCNAGVWYLSRAETLPVHRWSSDMADTVDEPRTAVLPLALQTDTDGSNSSAELSSELDQISLRDKSRGVKCRWVGCGLWFSHLDALAIHVTRVHATVGQRGLFYCGWDGCTRGDRGFNARYKMLVHVRTHTNEKPHHCYKCDKSFSRAENLKIHARSHTGERPYVCPIPGCGKAYSNSSDRFKHTRTHSVDKPYCCKVPGCPKRYTDPSSLRKHVKTYRHFPDIKDEDVTTKIICDEDTSPYKTCGFGSPEKEVKTAEENINNGERTLCTREWEKDAALVAGINGCVSLSTKAVQMGAPMSCDPCRGVPVVAEDVRYGLLHSWLRADLAPHPLPLPWGLSVWTGPWLQERRSDSSLSSDEELVQMQDLPLDLTVQRASTVT